MANSNFLKGLIGVNIDAEQKGSVHSSCFELFFASMEDFQAALDTVSVCAEFSVELLAPNTSTTIDTIFFRCGEDVKIFKVSEKRELESLQFFIEESDKNVPLVASLIFKESRLGWPMSERIPLKFSGTAADVTPR